jgi:Zn-dependent alcohol dehydrogenase
VTRQHEGPRAFPRGLLMLFAVVFGMAPTVGDIGSCGQSVDDLDVPTFFVLKSQYDCQRCGECGLSRPLCDQACAGTEPATLPTGCQPLVHDGEVCLNAILYASCGDFASYTDPVAPKAPSECQFCPAR